MLKSLSYKAFLRNKKNKLKFDGACSLIYNFFQSESGTLCQHLGCAMNSYSIEFQNQSFKIKTEHDEKAFQALKSEVDQRVQEIQNLYKKISVEKALFLACLQLAEDKYLLKKALNENLNRLEIQAKSLLDELADSPYMNFEIS